jgi:hypothetical protein
LATDARRSPSAGIVALGLRVASLSVLLIASPGVQALDIQHAQASFIDEEYRFELTAVIDAPVQYVETVLRDYPSYTALDARILEARVLERPTEHSALLATTLRACFGPICRSIKRIERVEESPGLLLATTDPARSDMKFGETRTQVEGTDEGRTRVSYQTRLKPDFWVPALVARRLMLETLEDATLDLFRNVERKAQGAVHEAETTEE